MRPRDLKIGVQMRIGLGIILVLVVLLGVVAWLQADGMWQETQGLYEHPLTVRRALGELTADILTIHLGMSDLVSAENDSERQEAKQSIDAREADANRQFAVLYDRYLGPSVDIDAANNAFVRWKAIREETIRLLRAGEVAEAKDRTRLTGVGGRQREEIMGYVQKISDFSKNRGDQFYLAAQEKRGALRRQLLIVLVAIVLVSLGVGYLILRGVRRPLKELTFATEQYRHGNLDARSRYASANEFGALAASFNDLAGTVQTNAQSRQKAARIAAVMLSEEEPRSFCRELLKALLQDTGSQVGALYLLNEAKTDFEHFESIGLATGGRESFSAAELEGELGAALATRQIQRITERTRGSPSPQWAVISGPGRS
jgi:methyl-accepting chemotaxis protein